MKRALILIILVQTIAIVMLTIEVMRDQNDSDLEVEQTQIQDTEESRKATVPRREATSTGAVKGETPAVEKSETPEAGAFDSSYGSVLFGRVTTSDGGALEQERIRVEKKDRSVNDRTAQQYATVASDGSYAFGGLDPGIWTVICKVKGYLEFRADVDFSEPAPRRFDVVLQKAVVLKVKVTTPDGIPLKQAMEEAKLYFLQGLIVVASEEQPNGNFPMTPYRSHSRFGDGEWRDSRSIFGGEVLPKEYAGQIELKVTPPVYLSLVLRHAILETKMVPAGTEEVEFVVSIEKLRSNLSAVKGRFVDARTGEPLPSVRVGINDRQSSGPGELTADDGSFEQTELRPGIMAFNARAQGYGGRRHFIKLEPGKTLDLGTMKLHPAVTIKGRVVDASGEGVRVSLLARNLDHMTFEQLLSTGMRAQSELDGTFTIGGVGPGKYLIQANKKGMAIKSTVVNVGENGASDIQLVVEEGTKVTVQTKTRSTDYFLLTIKNSEGASVISRFIWDSWNLDYRLAPGQYVAKLYRDEALIRSKSFTVGAKDLTVDLQ